MTTEQKSDSINFDNEQVEQRTLGSDEEREIKQPEENKTNTKSGERKNKSQNRFNKIKLPPIKRSKKGQPIYKGLDPPAANINNYSNIMNQNFVEDEELYPEIKIVKKEIRNLNKELKNLRNEYYIMEEQNLTYKYMIEKILNSKQNQVINNNENDNDEEGENYIKEKIMEREEEIKNNEKIENDQGVKKKKSKKKKPKSDADIKISVLKKQNSSYDDTLHKNDILLEELRKNEKSIQYQTLIYSINAKNDELSENLSKNEKLNQSLIEYETKIKYYMLKAQKFNNEIYKMSKEIEENGKIIEKFNEDIKEYKSKKESLNKKQNIMEEEIKDNKKRKEEFDSECKDLDKEIESNQSISKEKKSNENFLNNFDYEQKELLSIN